MNIAAIFSSGIFVKIVVLFLLAAYIIFASVIFSQIKMLNKIINQFSSPLIERLGFIHIMLVVSLFLLAIVIL